MFLWARPIASVSARAADSDARASVMASDAAERCAEVLRAGARGPEGAEARARAVALAEEVGHARPTDPNDRTTDRTVRDARGSATRRDDAMRNATRDGEGTRWIDARDG